MNTDLKEVLKSAGLFFAIALSVIGAGCSTGWLAYHKEWVPLVGNIIVVILAFPKWRDLVKKLIGEE